MALYKGTRLLECRPDLAILIGNGYQGREVATWGAGRHVFMVMRHPPSFPPAPLRG